VRQRNCQSRGICDVDHRTSQRFVWIWQSIIYIRAQCAVGGASSWLQDVVHWQVHDTSRFCKQASWHTSQMKKKKRAKNQHKQEMRILVQQREQKKALSERAKQRLKRLGADFHRLTARAQTMPSGKPLDPEMHVMCADVSVLPPHLVV